MNLLRCCFQLNLCCVMNNFPLYRKNTEILISVYLMANPRKRKEKERVSAPKRRLLFCISSLTGLMCLFLPLPRLSHCLALMTVLQDFFFCCCCCCLLRGQNPHRHVWDRCCLNPDRLNCDSCCTSAVQCKGGATELLFEE